MGKTIIFMRDKLRPIDPSCKEKKFHLRLATCAESSVSFSFAFALERCLFTTRHRPTDLVRERETDSRRILLWSNVQLGNDYYN